MSETEACAMVYDETQGGATGTRDGEVAPGGVRGGPGVTGKNGEAENKPSRAGARSGKVQVRECLAVLSAAGVGLAGFKARGGDPDRWSDRCVREAMAEALTQAEDELEFRAGAQRAATRDRMRVLRRRLEGELNP